MTHHGHSVDFGSGSILPVAIDGQTGAIDGTTAINGPAMACIDGRSPTSSPSMTDK